MQAARAQPPAGRDRLVMLAKPPQPGRVKSRLTGPGGWSPEQAAELYAACVADLAERWQSSVEWTFEVCCPPGSDESALRRCVPAGTVVRQEPVLSPGPRDLGVAMTDILTAAFAAGAGRVILVGSDAPHLPAACVREAFALLRAHDLVLGPDEGGGCYLIGASQPTDIMTAVDGAGPIAWSQGTDYREIVRRASARGLRVGHLRPTFDLDLPADVERLRTALASGSVDAACLPRVVAALGRLAPQ
jgi:hypothetical protein